MQVFVFGSARDDDVSAFSKEKDGRNLPADFSPWLLLGSGIIERWDTLAGVIGGGAAALEGITRDGFFLTRAADYVAAARPRLRRIAW